MQRQIAVFVLLLVASPAYADTLRKVEALWTSSQEGEIRRKVEQVREQIEVALALANAVLQNNTPLDARVDAVVEAAAGIDEREVAAQGSAADRKSTRLNSSHG